MTHTLTHLGHSNKETIIHRIPPDAGAPIVGVALAFLTAGLGPIVALTRAPLAIAILALVIRAGSTLAPQPARVHAGL